ncbi:MAG: hypothetical protein NTX11_02410, partial [Candidatus Saccharibacteria bacterium]|nr:hypothetical protein [Candidatus Saccharibacteria bacterium]
MNDNLPKHRNNLNSSQLSILYDLYKFRFATSDLLMKSQGLKTKRSLHPRLKILLDQEYIGRNYESSYRLQNKYATYYLRTNGINVLKKDATFDKRVLTNISRDNKRTDTFITGRLDIFTIYTDFKKLYGDKFRFFTDSYLRGFKYFPKPLPGGYVQFKDDESQHFFIDFIRVNVLYFVRRKLIENYIQYAKSRLWEN